MNQSREGLQLDMATAQYLLENLGFVINFEKSCFTPTQVLEFLGFLDNTRDMTLHLPDYKVTATKADCHNLIVRREVSVRELSQLIGKLTALIQAIFPAPLHYRHLQHLKHRALAQHKGRATLVASPPECLERAGYPSPDLIIETDASRAGWGAVYQKTRR